MNSPSVSPALARQRLIGRLQTAVLLIVLAQVIFAGVLRALPPETRAGLAFLHRIEWGVYAGIGLILAQVLVGWRESLAFTNRLYLLAWPFGRRQAITGPAARRIQIGWLILAALLLAAALWVRVNGFIVTPAPR